MYVHMYVRVHSVHVYVHCARVSVYMYMCVYISKHCACIRMHECVCVCAYVCLCAHMSSVITRVHDIHYLHVTHV